MARALVIAYTTYIHDGRVKRHAEALARRGDQVDAITLAAGKTGLINGVNVIGLEIPRYRGSSRVSYLKSYLSFFVAARRKALKSFSRDRVFDLAIVCTMPDAAILSALPLRRRGTKLVLDVHDTMPELYRDKFPRPDRGDRRSHHEAGRTAERAVGGPGAGGPRTSVRQRLADYGIRADKIRVVAQSPDDRIFSPEAAMTRDPAFFTLMCHGTVTHRMGLEYRGARGRPTPDRIPQLRLMALGAGDYLNEIRALVSELNLQDRVILKDMIPIEELPRVLRTADVGLVPNRESSATHLMLPVKLLEFSMLGIPAIAAKLRTIEYYFGNGSVRFFKPGDINDLANGIEQLYRSPALRAAYAESARKVVDQISWPNQRGEFYRAIDSILPRCESVNPATVGQRQAGSVASARMEG